MNEKKSKKIRQEARRIYRDTMQEMAEVHSRIIKPKPRWFPMWLWIRLLSIFIFIKK